MKEALILDSFDRYFERTQYVKEALESFGYNVKIVQSDFCHVEKKYVEVKNPDIHYVHAKKYTKNLSVKRILSHLNIGKKIIKKADEYSPEIVYCLLPVNSIAKKVRKYAKKKGARLFFDVFDLWPESMPVSSKIKKLLFPWKKMRDSSLRFAEKVFLECNFYKEFLPKAGNYKTAYLCKGETARKLNFDHQDKLRFVYLGSVNSLIDIDATIDFLKKVNQTKSVEVVLIGGGENKESLLNAVKSAGIDFVDYGMLFDENEKDKIISTCHFGLNVYKESTTIGLTLKSMDYFCRGLPIVTKGIADTSDICDKYDCGIVVQKNGTFNELKIVELSEESWLKMSQNSINAYNDLFTYQSFLNTLREVIE